MILKRRGFLKAIILLAACAAISVYGYVLIDRNVTEVIVLKANPSKSEVLGCLSEPVEKPKPWYKHYTSLRFGEKVKVHIKKEAFKKRGLRFGDVIRIVYSRYTPTDVPVLYAKEIRALYGKEEFRLYAKRADFYDIDSFYVKTIDSDGKSYYESGNELKSKERRECFKLVEKQLLSKNNGYRMILDYSKKPVQSGPVLFLFFYEDKTWYALKDSTLKKGGVEMFKGSRKEMLRFLGKQL